MARGASIRAGRPPGKEAGLLREVALALNPCSNIDTLRGNRAIDTLLAVLFLFVPHQRLTTSVPLFTDEGKPTWLPGVCPEPECRAEVETIVAAQGPRRFGGRPVTVQPCGHLAYITDPIEVTLS